MRYLYIACVGIVGIALRSLKISNVVLQQTCLGVSVLVAVVFGVACSPQNNSGSNDNSFRYNEPDGIAGLDPATASYQSAIWATGHLYNGLVELDSMLRVTPCIAREWSVDSTGKHYTFHLRTDVMFHDDSCFRVAGYASGTRRVVASDVVYSIKRVFNGTAKSTGAWVYRDRVRYVEALNDSTVHIELFRPFAPFLSLLTMPYGYIVPHEAIELYGDDFDYHPVGTGPFRFNEWKPDIHLQLVRNPHYFKFDAQGNRLPYLDTVQISFIRDTKSEFLEFLHGNFDVVTSVDASLAPSVYDGAGTLKPAFQHLQLWRAPALSVEYYGMLLDSTKPAGNSSPLSRNRLLRQALNYAIDRHRIVTYVLHGRGIPCKHGFLPPGLPGYSDRVGGYVFDQDRARALLAEAGFPNGRGLPTLLLQLGNNPRTASVAEAIQEQWKDIGVHVELRQVDFPQHLSQVRSGALPMWRTSWIGDYPDPENFLALFISANKAPAGPNTTHLSSPTLDSLYDAALNPALSLDERKVIYEVMQQEVVDQAPWIFLYHDVILRLTHRNIRGFRVDGTGRMTLEHVYKQFSS